MGSCCSSCLKRILPSSSTSPSGAGGGGKYSRTHSSDMEITLRHQNTNKYKKTQKNTSSSSNTPFSLCISDSMSAPTILAYDSNDNEEEQQEREKQQQEEEGLVRISGYGLALMNIPIEQDAAYWEWYIEKDDGRRRRRKIQSQDDKLDNEKEKNDDGENEENHDDEDDEEFDDDEYLAMKFGLATKKDPSFYQVQESSADEDSTPMEDGTALMRSISVTTGDTVGIAVQQSDLPMLQFLINGELISEIAINRFRGTVYPAIYVREGYTVLGIFKESEFRELSPHARFGPLMAARGII